MKKIGVGLCCVALVPMGGYAWFSQALGDDPNGRVAMAQWVPTSATLRQQVQADTSPDNTKLQTFFLAFGQRYRDHGHSVKVIGQDQKHLVMKIAAQDPPWTVNQIVISLWQELKTDFRMTPEIEIYATYIGLPSQHIGSVRPLANDPNTAHIVFFPHGR